MALGREKQNNERSPGRSRTTRVWPSLTNRVVCLLLVIAGPIGVIGSIVVGFPLAAPVFALLSLLGARLVGWVEVDDEMLRHRRLIGASTEVRFADVSEVGIGMHQGRKSKWWYPEVATLDGRSVKFLLLKTLSGKKNLQQVERIFAECMAHAPPEEEDQFTTVTTSADGELEFQLSPGYDEFRREKAELEAAGSPPAALELVSPILEVAHIPERRLRTGNEIPFIHGDRREDAPEVFDPAPLTYSGKPERHLSAVTGTEDPGVVNAAESPVLQPPPIPQKLPTLIEQPSSSTTSPGASKANAGETGREFTSLFSRAA